VSDAPGSGARLAALAALVGLAAIVAHASSLANGFVYDDGWTVVDNPVARDPANLGRLLGSELARDGVPDAARPAFLASVIADGVVARGLGAPHAVVAHAHGLVLHALVSIAVLLLFVRLSFGLPLASFAATLFAVHPANVEAVAVVSYREDLLASLGVLVALALLVPAASSRARALLAGAVAFVAVALAGFAKESAYVSPILMATLELWREPVPRRRVRAAAAVMLAALAAGVSAVWRSWVLGRADVVSLGAEVPRDVPVASRLATGCAALLRGTLRFLSVRGYAPEYPTSWQTPAPPAVGALAILAVAAILVVAWRARRRWPGVTLGVAFAFVAALPTLGVVPITNVEADRYLYLSSAGLCLAAADALRRGFLALGRVSNGEVLGVPRPAAAAIVVVALVAAQSPGVTAMWHDDLRLWSRAVELQPLAPRAWANLGAARARAGQTLAALAAAERSLALADVAGTRALVGLVRLEQGDVAGGCAALEAALDRLPVGSERRVDVLDGLGRCELARGSSGAAINWFEAAASAAPRADAPVVHLVAALERSGRTEEAIDRLRRYVRANPDSAVGWRLLAERLRARGDAEARAAEDRARALAAFSITSPG
jgi:tetratricopeptide (TPR) repeat protein